MPASAEPSESESLLANPVEADEQQRPREEVAEKPKKWIHFGPVYGEDTEDNIRAKDSAWEALLKLEGGDGDETSYLRSIEQIQKKAVDDYEEEEEILKWLQPSQSFRSMMAKDGCFFLLLALHILGAGALLGYPKDHPYFGAESDSSSYLPAMFFIWNQIPYVVINALREQPFFKKVIKKGMQKGTWSPPPRDPVKLALYRMVVEPRLTGIRYDYLQPLDDILSALHKLLLGSVRDIDFMNYEIMESRDLEAAAGSSSKESFPSARKLSKLGVRFRKTNKGIAGIRFKNLSITALLHLPPIIIDEHSDQILSNLIRYELKLTEDQRRVTAYLHLLIDLAPTYRDFSILRKCGIIELGSSSSEIMQIFLQKLAESTHDTKYTPNILEIRRKIIDYQVVPWCPISFVCSIACSIITFIIAVLTIIQTVFTVLSYYKDKA